MRFGYVVRPRADRDIDEIAGYLAEEARLDMAPQVTTPIFDPMFSEQSFGFRPGAVHKTRSRSLPPPTGEIV